MVKVSIIIPVYNVARYIKRCLNSVAAQTFQDIECILINDCTKDNSMMIVNNYISNYKGDIAFKIIHHTHNQGLSAARNSGIKESKGDFLFFLDSDDSITPDCIESLLFLFSKYPDINFAQGNILQEDGTISPYGFNNNIPEYLNEKDKIYEYLLSRITTSAWNRLIRRSFIFENSLFFPVGMIHEDMYWLYFVAKDTKAVAFSHKGTYTYYINEGSILTSITKEKRIARYSSRLNAAQKYLEDICQIPSNKYQRQYIAINLLSCLPELIALHSVYNWLYFWRKIISFSIEYYYKADFYRFLFLLTLLPPTCFFSGLKKYRWHIQATIVNKL